MSTTGSPTPSTVTHTDSAGARAIEKARDVSASSSTMRSHIGHSAGSRRRATVRSEEHTSELQSQSNLVCRLLLEKKKITNLNIAQYHIQVPNIIACRICASPIHI